MSWRTRDFGLRIKRAIGLSKRIVFCVNTGRCGSEYIVKLLQANRVAGVYHEPFPALLEEGIDYYHGRVSKDEMVRLLQRTRAGVYVEANNRLFSLIDPIVHAFPECEFIYLHRDGRDVVRSGLERDWYGPRDPSKSVRIFAEEQWSQFVKICNYWAKTNQRIIDDLQKSGRPSLWLPFDRLVSGDATEELEAVVRRRLTVRKIDKVNHTVRRSVSAYAQWSNEWRSTFDEICGEMMRQLGYSATFAKKNK